MSAKGSKLMDDDTPWEDEAPTIVPAHDREAHRQVARIENFAQALYALPARFADHMAGLHPYDVADAIMDLLAPEPQEEPLAEWERQLLYGSTDSGITS